MSMEQLRADVRVLIEEEYQRAAMARKCKEGYGDGSTEV